MKEGFAAQIDLLLRRSVLSEPLEWRAVALSRELASLGDAFLNLIYSLALSEAEGRPVGKKVSNRVLAEAVKRSGLRSLLPRRLSRRDLGGAAEALLLYAVAGGMISAAEVLESLKRHRDAADAFSRLLVEVKRKWPGVG